MKQNMKGFLRPVLQILGITFFISLFTSCYKDFTRPILSELEYPVDGSIYDTLDTIRIKYVAIDNEGIAKFHISVKKAFMPGGWNYNKVHEFPKDSIKVELEYDAKHIIIPSSADSGIYEVKVIVFDGADNQDTSNRYIAIYPHL